MSTELPVSRVDCVRYNAPVPPSPQLEALTESLSSKQARTKSVMSVRHKTTTTYGSLQNTTLSNLQAIR